MGRASKPRFAGSARRGPEGSALPGLRGAALGCASGALRCSPGQGGCGTRPLRAVFAVPQPELANPRRPAATGGRLPLSGLRSSPAPMRPGRALPSGRGDALPFAPHATAVPARLRAGRSGREWAAPSSAGARGLPEAQPRDGEDCSSSGCGSPQAARRGRVAQPPSRPEQRRGERGRARVPADSCSPRERASLRRALDVGAADRRRLSARACVAAALRAPAPGMRARASTGSARTAS